MGDDFAVGDIIWYSGYVSSHGGGLTDGGYIDWDCYAYVVEVLDEWLLVCVMQVYRHIRGGLPELVDKWVPRGKCWRVND